MPRAIHRVDRVVPGGPTSQVQMKQSVVPFGQYQRTSPFLTLSEDWFGAPGGFETHPHRGMQTVTMVLEGELEHRDHTGAHGVLRAGDVQWMTAGRGVLHSEMPHGGTTAHTLQLWLNLPRAMKMIPARYTDQRLAATPVRKLEKGEVRVYAGRSGEVHSPHGSDYPMTLLEIHLEAGARLEHEIPAADRGFVYVLEGRGTAGGKELRAGDVGWFEPGEGSLSFEGTTGMKALLASSQPIQEPVVAYGPFVMNTEQEIRQAFMDYQSGRLTLRD